MSDDSGLEVDCLGGEPGIFSARWAKDFGSFDKAMTEILSRVEKAKQGNEAQFVCSLTMRWPEGKKISKVGVIKGNISLNGEKIYHLPSGQHYNATKISKFKGEKWFCSEHEAKTAGWRKSKK